VWLDCGSAHPYVYVLDFGYPKTPLSLLGEGQGVRAFRMASRNFRASARNLPQEPLQQTGSHLDYR